jgi:hypothetical protein
MRRRRTRSPLFEPLEDRLCLDAGAVPPQFPGSPAPLPNGAWTQTGFFGSPIFADLFGSGQQELLVEAAGGKMFAYFPDASGNLVKVKEYDATPMPDGRIGNFKSTPVVVQVPGIGTVILAALGHDEFNVGLPNALEDGRVFAFNALTGQILPGWLGGKSTHYPPPGTESSSGVTGALTIGYLEGNGMPDVIVDSSSSLVTAFRMNGTTLWTYENDESVEPGAVVADLYGDGKQEVIIDSGMTPAAPGAPSFYPGGGYITILNGADGSMLRRIHTGEAFFGSPIVADLYGDGRKEIIGATGPYLVTLPYLTPAQQQAARAAGNRVYAYFPDGTPVPGWPYHTTANDTLDRQTWKEPIAADLFGNGQNEVLDIDRSGVLHVIGPNGQDIPGFVGGLQINSSVPYVPVVGDDLSTPIVADVNGDGRQDIVVSRGYYLAAYTNTGQLIWSTNTPVTPGTGIPGAVESAAAYGRFNPGGPPALAFVSSSATPPGPPSYVQVFQLPASPVTPSWPMLRDDPMGRAIALSSAAESRFVTKAYQALLGQAPNQAVLNYYVSALVSKVISEFDLARGLAKLPQGLARFPGLLNGTDAAITAKVTPIFQALGYPTVPSDSLAALIYDAHHGGRTLDDAASLIVGSAGRYAALNGVASWVITAWRDAMGYTPSPDWIAYIVSLIDKGTSLQQMAVSLLSMPDARKFYVGTEVALLLGRYATAADYTAYTGYGHREDVIVAIAAGPEFWALSGGNPTGFVNRLFNTVLGFAPPASILSAYVAALSNGTLTRAAVAQQLVTGQSGSFYLQNVVVSSLFKYIPDPSKGDLRARLGVVTPIDNPDPGMVTYFSNLLIAGQATQEQVLAAFMTSYWYLTDASYLRGLYVSPGIRV